MTREEAQKMMHEGYELIEVLTMIAGEQAAEEKTEKKAKRRTKRSNPVMDEIKQVIFNPPATVVFWKDRTKTVVKTQGGEEYDPEKGLAMCIVKKACGNTRAYYDVFLKYARPEAEQEAE